MIGNVPAITLVGTLVHEAAHTLNFERGIRDCSRSQYHNQKFKIAAEELGLDVTQVPHYGFATTMMRAETAMRYAIETAGLSVVLMHRRAEVIPTTNPKGTGDKKSDNDQDHDNGKDKGGRYKKAACTCPYNIRVSRKVMTTSTTCSDCNGGDGKPKEAYVSEAAAELRARIVLRERGVSLDVYECPHGNGWHLTKG